MQHIRSGKKLDKVVRSVSKITGCSQPSIASLCPTRIIRKARNITSDSSHPPHYLFDLLCGRRCRSIKSRTSRFWNCTYLKAIRLLKYKIKVLLSIGTSTVKTKNFAALYTSYLCFTFWYKFDARFPSCSWGSCFLPGFLLQISAVRVLGQRRRRDDHAQIV